MAVEKSRGSVEGQDMRRTRRAHKGLTHPDSEDPSRN